MGRVLGTGRHTLEQGTSSWNRESVLGIGNMILKCGTGFRNKEPVLVTEPREKSKRDVFITVTSNIFTIFYGPSEKCKASTVYWCQ